MWTALRVAKSMQQLLLATVLTLAISPLWWVSHGGVPVLAMALQPWSTAILFNGMAPAWDPSAEALTQEFVLAATLTVLVSVSAYALIVAGIRRAWRRTSSWFHRLLFAFGILGGYGALVVVCLTLTIIDFPTIPAPQKVERLLEREFGIEPESRVRGARYTYYGLRDWSEFYRFPLPHGGMAQLISEAGYRPVVLKGASAEAMMKHRDALAGGVPYWWRPPHAGRDSYFEKRVGGTKSYLILDRESERVFLRRDHF